MTHETLFQILSIHGGVNYLKASFVNKAESEKVTEKAHLFMAKNLPRPEQLNFQSYHILITILPFSRKENNI